MENNIEMELNRLRQQRYGSLNMVELTLSEFKSLFKGTNLLAQVEGLIWAGSHIRLAMTNLEITKFNSYTPSHWECSVLYVQQGQRFRDNTVALTIDELTEPEVIAMYRDGQGIDVLGNMGEWDPALGLKLEAEKIKLEAEKIKKAKEAEQRAAVRFRRSGGLQAALRILE